MSDARAAGRNRKRLEEGEECGKFRDGFEVEREALGRPSWRYPS
jgi:hypothetical protein